MESDEIKVRRFGAPVEAHMSSYAYNNTEYDPRFSAASIIKRRRRFPHTTVIILTLWFIVMHCWSSSFYSNMVVASPVEEDPQTYNAGANGGLSFSINSPRKNDGSRRQGNDDRDQKPISSVDDRKRIKVMSNFFLQQ